MVTLEQSTKSWSVGATLHLGAYGMAVQHKMLLKANAQLEQAKEANLATVDAVLLAVQKSIL